MGVGEAEIGDAKVACLFGQTVTDQLWVLGTLGGTNSKALAMNGNMRVVGQAENSEGRRRAFYYRNGTMWDLNYLIDPRQPALLTSAFAINDSESILAEGSYGGQPAQFFLTLEEPFVDVLKIVPAGIGIYDGGNGYKQITFPLSGPVTSNCVVQVSTDLKVWEDTSAVIRFHEWPQGPVQQTQIYGERKFYRMKMVP